MWYFCYLNDVDEDAPFLAEGFLVDTPFGAVEFRDGEMEYTWESVEEFVNAHTKYYSEFECGRLE